MTTFSAGPQALGYLYQARAALAFLIEADDGSTLRIESLDDIELTDSGGSLSLTQLKHHVSDAVIADHSPDLWKSIRVWATEVADKSFLLENTRLHLFTTASAQPNSVAACLGTKDRDETCAVGLLEAMAAKAPNKALEKSYQAFLALSRPQRCALVASITVQTSEQNIQKIEQRIRRAIRPSVRAQFVDALLERVEGWWFSEVISHLLTPNRVPHLSAFSLHERIASLSETFHEESLPIDFTDKEPGNSFVQASQQKMYVRQLRAIDVTPRTVTKAILDFYRAFEQRTKWLSEGLVSASELQAYESVLVDEWERYCDAHCLSGKDLTESEYRELGRKVFQWAQMEALHLKIRPRVSAEFVRRGTFHFLADSEPKPRLYWRPDFLQSLQAVLNE